TSSLRSLSSSLSSFLNHHAPPESYSLPLPDALPISKANTRLGLPVPPTSFSGETTRTAPVAGSRSRLASCVRPRRPATGAVLVRSEEHTSELQSLTNLVCRLLLEEKKSTLYVCLCRH